MALVLIDEPKGVYYGGTVAGPVMKELLQNALPYMGIEPIYNDEEILLDEVKEVIIPDLEGMSIKDAQKELKSLDLEWEVVGGGETVNKQFPKAYENVNAGSKIKLYTEISLE
jgi:stage V sporulation protein D (sporulation-specific penicillin-binding protein)